jgi:hypothetical protein
VNFASVWTAAKGGAIGLVVTCALAVAGEVPAATSSCRAGELRLSASFYGEAGGQFIQTFTFTNTGSATCSLQGWPRLQLTDRSGRSSPARSIEVVQGGPGSRPFRTVLLHSQGAASFDVFGADWNAAANRACPKTFALLVAASGVAPLPVRVALPYCSPFYVAPLISGRTDRDSWSTVWAKRWCRIGQFSAGVGPGISEATGQHTLALRLTNHGRACTLLGRPALWFADARGRIPFELRGGTDQMIRASYALPVRVGAGHDAWVVINHYRCDLGVKRAAGSIRIGLQDAAYANSIKIRLHSPQQVDYCGRGDPGSTIIVAPFEPTLNAALHG